MQNDDNLSAPGDWALQQTEPATPWLAEQLTEAEIESLRQNQKEALAYAQKAFFPNARIHRSGDDSHE